MTKGNEGPLARILKLLDKAESVASSAPAEAEALRERAYELAAKATIDEAMVRWKHQHGAGRFSEPEQVVNKFLDVGRPFAQQAILANIVYPAFGLKLLKISGFKNRLHVFGFKSDMDRADMMFASLVVQCTRESVRGFREYLQQFDDDGARRGSGRSGMAGSES
jgi:hypothetical protein